ncbi:efflux RND transporter periplasmic adaptor subunit [Adhaeribacter aquaticus]|uniref:efflux RND transporter periplasmic adaptor subunit n=1 Tax=Adhaeribacter aquaticus TaxID=299567 RepID=UPI000412C33B|nr:efflux RND transporter periplasmic adaptor subunit [Adhaeribacter aquaticus]
MNNLEKFNWIFNLVIGAFVFGCTANGQTDKKLTSPPSMPVTRVVTKDTLLHQDYVADVQASKHVEMRARVTGYLENILVDEGQMVKKGQPLFRINPTEYKAEVDKAKANLNSAIAEAKGFEVEVEQVKLLVNKKVISASELKMAQSKLGAAKARIEEARSAYNNAATRLTYTYIRAPFAGVIDRIPLKVGSLIDEGTLLTTISDLENVFVYFKISEKEYLNYVKSKDKGNSSSNIVELILADGSTYPLKGKIETMDGIFESNTGSIAFRAKFPNRKQLLKHHSSGMVRLTSEVDDALIIPQKAAIEIQDRNFVYVVDKNNRVKIRSFKPKNRLSHFYIVESGLQAGEQVVYEGVQDLKDGTVIKPVQVPMDSIFAAAY